MNKVVRKLLLSQLRSFGEAMATASTFEILDLYIAPLGLSESSQWDCNHLQSHSAFFRYLLVAA